MKKLILILIVLCFLSGCISFTKTYDIRQEITSYNDPNTFSIRTSICFYNQSAFGKNIYWVVVTYNMEDSHNVLKYEYEKAVDFIATHKKLDYKK